MGAAGGLDDGDGGWASVGQVGNGGSCNVVGVT